MPFCSKLRGVAFPLQTMAFDLSQALVQYQTKQAFDAQAKLDGSIRKLRWQPRLPLGVANHRMSRPDQARRSMTLALRTTLYTGQLTVLYLTFGHSTSRMRQVCRLRRGDLYK